MTAASTTASAPAIEARGLRFEYPGVLALDGVGFEVERASVTALVGPNGAGKTTLLRCLAGLDRPLEGTITVAGVDVVEEPRASHRKIGFLSDFFGLYDDLSVRQCLSHASASNGVAPERVAAAVEATARRLEISSKLDAKAGALSRGQRQRVAIGQAIVHGPEVLLLDEPASGLDPEARHSLALLFSGLRDEGVTLVVSSHILAELDQYSSHMLVMREGRIVDNRPLHDAGLRGQRVRVQFASPVHELRQRLAALEGLRVLEAEERSALLEVYGGATGCAQLLSRLVEARLPVCEFAEEREDLQASYLRTVGAGAPGGGGRPR